MSEAKLWVSAALAIAAAFRLVLWRWHVQRDAEWLARHFGGANDNHAIAQAHSMAVAGGLAAAAVAILYA